MKRRVEQLVVVAVVTVAAAVPTTVIAAVTTRSGEHRDNPSAARAAQADRAPQAESTSPVPGSVTPSPGASTRAGAASPAQPSTPRKGAAQGSGTTSTGGGAGEGRATGLRSYLRVTEVRLSGASNGDYEHIIENASFTLAPAFALDATGVRTSVRDGRTTKITQKVIVKGDTMWGYDGKAWSRSTLTTAQLDKLRTGSDPLEFTALMRSVPGVTRTRPDASGSTRYTAGVRVGDFLRLLPDPAGTTRQLRARMPQSAGVTLNLWANAQDRPTRIGLGAAVPGVQFTGSMTFTSYK